MSEERLSVVRGDGSMDAAQLRTRFGNKGNPSIEGSNAQRDVPKAYRCAALPTRMNQLPKHGESFVANGN
jgi:hypothetical protein